MTAPKLVRLSEAPPSQLTVLCDECFPSWRDHEVLTIGSPLTPCRVCGRMDRRPGKPVCHLFPRDPRPAGSPA